MEFYWHELTAAFGQPMMLGRTSSNYCQLFATSKIVRMAAKNHGEDGQNKSRCTRAINNRYNLLRYAVLGFLAKLRAGIRMGKKTGIRIY
jgi:hypothetical protein